VFIQLSIEETLPYIYQDNASTNAFRDQIYTATPQHLRNNDSILSINANILSNSSINTNNRYVSLSMKKHNETICVK
jgi:hypothetical protein